MDQKTPLSQLRQYRIDKLNKIRELGIDPYPAKPNRTHSISEALNMLDQEVSVAGRIMSVRGHGNLLFLDLKDASAQMQIAIKKDHVNDVDFSLANLLDIGDFISVTGKIFKTHSEEITVDVFKLQILAKSLRPLPDSWYGLKDEEERYRRRYLDFILNPEVKTKILIRTKVIQEIRTFLISEGFIEVETPILETTASGALASPFTTHINAYDMDLYLRICIGELWQKKLMIAGFEKTFEIGRAFRNEGVDREHNPEFTMLEYYWGYANYEMNMDMQEKLISNVIKNVLGNYKIKFEDKEIDFTPPYPRKTFRDLILEKTQIDIDKQLTLEDLQKAMASFGLKIDSKWGRGHLIDEFYKEYIRPNLIQPVFVTHHPEDLKPLAKKDPVYKGYTQSFQLLANGFELTNNYSELNDPIDQAERFNIQTDLAAAGDDETMSADNEFVESLEYGMPPTSGTGIGIDRFVALLTNSHHIREIIPFPLMKPKEINIVNKNSINEPTQLSDEHTKRFIVVLNKKIEVGKLMNSLGHLTAGFVGTFPNLKEFEFLNYLDKENKTHAILSHFPFIILKADNSNAINNLRKQTQELSIPSFNFTQTMSIGTSSEQQEATKAKSQEEQEYYGIIMFGETEKLKPLTKNFSLFN